MTGRREEYLGDGVWASFDGENIRLRAPSEAGDNLVFLDPGVFRSLLDYARRVGASPSSAAEDPMP
jgi:hypothetical protein